MMPVVLAKLEPPSVSESLDLYRLMERYQRITGVPLTLVTAPAGSGKSTSLALWRAKQLDHVAWLSIEEYDDSPLRFCRYLLAALERGGILTAEEIPDLPLEATSDFFEEIVVELANLFAGSDRHSHLVLDDYHLIHDPAIHQAIEFLARNGGPRFHLILAGRSDPPLPVATLRAKGKLLELREKDLQFRLEETRLFLESRGVDALTPEGLRNLQQKTEGWIAGLQLSSLVLRTSDDPDQTAKEFAGTHRYILDYLADEVLAREPVEVRRFLLETSPLEELTPKICDALLQSGESATRLEDLARRNLFVQRHSLTDPVYRYHALMADVLRKLLERDRPGAYAKRCLEAAALFREWGQPKEAVEYYLRAGDIESATDTLDQFLEDLLDGGDFGLLTSLLQRIPEDVRSRRPRVAVLTALFLLLNGDPEGKTLYWLKKALEYDRYGQVGHIVAATQMAIEAVTAVRPDTSERLTKAIATVSGQTGFFERFLCRTLDMIEIAVTGNLKRGIPNLRESYVAAMDRGDVIGGALTALDVVNAELIAGNVRAAEDLCRSGLEIVGYEAGRRGPAAGLFMIAFGIVLYERNELLSARAFLSEGERLCQTLKLAGALDAALALSRVNVAIGDLGEARHALTRAQAISERSPVVSDGVRYVAAHEAQVELIAGRKSAVERWFSRSFGDERGFVERAELGLLQRSDYLLFLELELLIGTTHLLSAGSHEAPTKVLDWLESVARQRGRRVRLVQALTLRALLMDQLGEVDSALRKLEEALDIGEECGLLRSYLELGPGVVAFIRSKADNRPDLRYAAAIVRAHNEVDRGDDSLQLTSCNVESHLQEAPGANGTSPIEISSSSSRSGEVEATPNARPEEAATADVRTPLSPREQEVLELIAQGKSNKEIGAEIFVSLATVKWHSARIYEKLQVRNRTEAVTRARSLGLLD